ncbi:hypothetical protein [Tardiphaga sp. 709]|uniref:hypothetical protein n=1 Tax=Tardiphaga sp. 709 TaxID=3076039 RepID=UPI0028EB3B10|nr:hypothetical protein [Tardiphaga sp. 709]WNV07796.1 hypothetical protein RSO67_20045 [Tardiphaga sp. 709]
MPKAAIARFFPTNETSRRASPILLLSLEVVELLAEIEPNNSIIRTMRLRLRFISKRSEWLSSDGSRGDSGRNDYQEHSHAKTLSGERRTTANGGRLIWHRLRCNRVHGKLQIVVQCAPGNFQYFAPT